MQPIVEATSWMDWWIFAMKSQVLQSSSDISLSLAGTRCQFLVAKTVSTLWANLVLKRRDAVLAKVKTPSSSSPSRTFPMPGFLLPPSSSHRTS